MTQFSLFGAAAAEVSLDDLDGVMLAGGHWARSSRKSSVRPDVKSGAGDPMARLSVVVADRWRADALAAEFDAREVLGENAIVAATDGWSVRTDVTTALAASAARWSRGANVGPPPRFVLTAGGLRLWAIASGSRDDVGYLFATDSADSVLHHVAGAQLSRLGLAAVSLSRHGGPGWRITSVKRIRRLAELLGPAPVGSADHWARPSG